MRRGFIESVAQPIAKSAALTVWHLLSANKGSIPVDSSGEEAEAPTCIIGKESFSSRCVIHAVSTRLLPAASM